MDSAKIAAELELQFPEHALHLDSPILEEVEKARNPILLALVPMLMPRTIKNLLNDASIPYWVRTRTLKYGTDLDEFEKEKGGEIAWTAAQEPIQNMLAILKRNGGPFFLGKTRTFSCARVCEVLGLLTSGYFVQRHMPILFSLLFCISASVLTWLYLND
jgi:hypothetical protein